MWESLKLLLSDHQEWIQQATYGAFFFVLFIENGFPFGFFLPGDSFLFLSGFLSYLYPEVLQIQWLLFTLFLGAFLGSSLGYGLGRSLGSSWNQWLVRFPRFKKFASDTEKFYKRHGIQAFFWARFVPVVRTFLPLVAGLLLLNWKSFLLFNFLGVFFWILSLTGGGFLIAKSFPQSGAYLPFLLAAIVVFSILPLLWKIGLYCKKVYFSRS